MDETAANQAFCSKSQKARRSISDGLGRLKQVIEDPNALAFSTTYGYDARGNLKTVTQGTQPQRTFSYDLLSRLISASKPESGPINYGYDANSNLKTKLDARGITTTYNYDVLNRVTSRIYTNDPQNTPAVFYKYDGQTLPAGAPAGFNRGFSTGRLVAATYGTSTSSAGNYTGYDKLGRAVSSFQQTDGQNYGFSYGYNLASEMTSETYPSGRVVQTEYDAAGRLAGVKNQATGLFWAGATATDATNRIQYTAHGGVSATKLGNSNWEHTNFNSRLQPLQIGLGTSATNSSLLQLDYGYGRTNNNGNVLSQRIVVVGSPGLDVTQTYQYDTLNRLSSASEGGSWSQTYDMDRHGNRAIRIGSYIPTPALTPQSVNSTDFSAFNQSNNRIALSGFGYDTAGNLTRDPTTAANAMTYDAENKQISYTKAGVTTTYAYDGDGRRVKKADSTGTIIFVYNAGGQLIAEYHSDPVPPPAGGGGTSYLTTDHLGSTRVVTKQDGTVKARYDYLPFGEELGATIGQRTTGMGYTLPDSTRQKFTQKERDSESGLDYFLARYYSSAQGRFTSADQPFIGQDESNPQTWNLYSYTSNNPLNRVDPDGDRWFYKEDDKGRVTDAQWVNPNDDAPGEGWIEFVPTEATPSLRLYTEGGTLVTYLGENGDGSPSNETYWTGKVEDASMDIVGLFIPGRLGLKGLTAGASALWAKHLAKEALSEGAMGLVSKAAAREAVERLPISEAAKGAAKRAISRATTSSTIDVVKEGGSVVVRISRPGRNGHQVVESVIDSAGKKTVVQKAYDAAGKLVHYDPKN